MHLAFFLPGPAEATLQVLTFGVLAIAIVFAFWRICAKAGYPGWYSLATIVPVLNLVLFFFLAFSDWPALRRIGGLEQSYQ